jgi:hypothetical protein
MTAVDSIALGNGIALLRSVAESMTLDGQGSFSWFGQRGPRLPRSARKWMDDRAARTDLVNHLTQCLYANFYCRGEPMPFRDQPVPDIRAARTPFVNELSRANAARGTWHWGRLERMEDGYLVVRYGGLEVYALPEECGLAPGAVPEAGQPLRLRLGRDSLRSSPGYYLARGDRDLDTTRTLRWYWHLEPGIAAQFVEWATTELGRVDVPYHLKVLADPSLYVRCDAGVIYTRREDGPLVGERLALVYGAVGAHLRSPTPAFTRRLAPGVAIADDPGSGDSFGLDRCRLLADGLVRAQESGVTDEDGRITILVERFVEAGVDPERPYLAAGLEEVSLPVFEASTSEAGASTLRRRSRPSRRTRSTVDALAAAARIGDRICREAVWYRGRCQWVGAEMYLGSGGAYRMGYRTLPPTLYGGTAGVALFLGELGRATGDPGPRRTAIAAIRQALSSFLAPTRAASSAATGGASRVRPAGLYGGAMGLALVAARLGRMLGDEELSVRGAQLAERFLLRRASREGYDLLYGSAGRILGLLALESFNVSGARDAAVALGGGLVAAAERSPEGWSWPSDIPRRQNLTGLSHGAAGIALALVELGRRTGDNSFTAAAQHAIDYETAWFEPAMGNWPDFRLRSVWARRSRYTPPVPYTVYWCHGAPGIALQRIRAGLLRADAALLEDVRNAAATTSSAMTAWLLSGDEAFSICHGVLGNAEILREMAAVGESSLAILAEEAADEGLRRYGDRGDWPCSPILGDTPSLFLGRAGIGYFYLRLHDPMVPSVLAFDPDAWAA